MANSKKVHVNKSDLLVCTAAQTDAYLDELERKKRERQEEEEQGQDCHK